jgi:hypothetical protein
VARKKKDGEKLAVSREITVVGARGETFIIKVVGWENRRDCPVAFFIH